MLNSEQLALLCDMTSCLKNLYHAMILYTDRGLPPTMAHGGNYADCIYLFKDSEWSIQPLNASMGSSHITEENLKSINEFLNILHQYPHVRHLFESALLLGKDHFNDLLRYNVEQIKKLPPPLWNYALEDFRIPEKNIDYWLNLNNIIQSFYDHTSGITPPLVNETTLVL